MDGHDIRAFVHRDRGSVAALKRRYWAQRFREDGPDAPWQTAQALSAHMRTLRPEWPTEADREDDWRHHLELKRKLDRTAHARRRR